MKRLLLLSLLLGTISGAAFAQQYILSGQWSMQGNRQDIICSVKDGETLNLGGISGEFLLEHFGFGSSVAFGLNDNIAGELGMNWDLKAFMSYHFFRSRAFLDPFVQAGGGAYGNLTFLGDPCSGDLELSEQFSLAFYPYLAAGLGFRFRGGLYAAGQFNWRPVSASVPCSDIFGVPESREYELVVSVGYAFGSHR